MTPAPTSAGARPPLGGAAWHGHLPTIALALLALVLYARGIVVGFVGDDYTLLDAALRVPLGELLSGRHGIPGYYRPVSRELYFWWWGRILGFSPGGFHLVNGLTYAAVVVLLDRLGRAWAGPAAGRLAAAAFVVFPPGSALLSWVSCAQDLIALFWASLAMWLYHRGRHPWAGLAAALAALSKETAIVLPVALAVMEWLLHPGATPRARLKRLGPTVAGLVVAVGVSLGVRSTWPAGTAVAVWSPHQLAGAWQVPIGFARTVVPPDTGAGIAQALAKQPALLVIVAALAALAYPRRAAPGQQGRARGSGTTESREGAKALVAFGIALMLLAMVPVGFIVERWRGYFFSLAGVGGSLAAGSWLAQGPSSVARSVLALVAVINFGAGGIYRPVEGPKGAARHPHVNYAFFRDSEALSARLLEALEPWCASLRSLPRTFVAGLPPEPLFESVLGPGLRVTCRDTVARVRFLADFEPSDALGDFGVLRFDPRDVRFVHERADTRVRARVGEGFLVHARYDVAAECFVSAVVGRPVDRELSYPLTVALAAAGRVAEARTRWRDAAGIDATLEPALLAARLMGRGGAATPVRAGAPADTGASARAERMLTPLAAAALRTPWQPEPHRALGRALLEVGRPREATFELAAAFGMGHENADLAWLAQGYEAMGALDEALEAYQRALHAGLRGELYDTTRARFVALMRTRG